MGVLEIESVPAIRAGKLLYELRLIQQEAWIALPLAYPNASATL